MTLPLITLPWFHCRCRSSLFKAVICNCRLATSMARALHGQASVSASKMRFLNRFASVCCFLCWLFSSESHITHTDCAPGYFLQNSNCLPCPEDSFALGGLIGGSAIVVILLLAVNSSPRVQASLVPLQNGSYYLQVISLLAFVDISWPFAVRQTLEKSASISNWVDLSLSTCWITYTQRWLFSVCIPVGFGAIFLIIFILLHALKLRHARAHSLLLLRSYLSLLTVVYTYVVRECLAVFKRIRLHGDGDWVSPFDYNLVWDSGQWMLMRQVSTVGVVLYAIGIPFGLLLAVRHRWETATVRTLACGSLVTSYMPHAALWEPLISCPFRALCIVVTTFMTGSQALFGMATLLAIVMALQFSVRPFCNAFSNVEHVILLGSSLLAMSSLFIFYQFYDQTFGQTDQHIYITTIAYVCFYAALVAIVLSEFERDRESTAQYVALNDNGL